MNVGNIRKMSGSYIPILLINPVVMDLRKQKHFNVDCTVLPVKKNHI